MIMNIKKRLLTRKEASQIKAGKKPKGYKEINSTSNEIAIESIELAHEGIYVEGIDD